MFTTANTAVASILYGSAITVRSEEHGCFLEAQGANEAPTVRPDCAESLLGFERSVFSFIRAESSLNARMQESDVQFGAAVKLYSAATQLVAVVVKTESSSKHKVGLKVVMRPANSDPACSTFRVLSKFRSRGDASTVIHGDNVVLCLDNSDLFLGAVEGPFGMEVIASSDPYTWSICRYDRGVVYTPKALVHAGRVLAIEHRLYQAMLTHGPPLVPSEHRKHVHRHALWQVEDRLEDEMLFTDTESNSVTSDVYFSVPQSLDESSAVLGDAFQCSCNSLWIVENEDASVGGPLRAGETYRFRHVATGRYLCVAPGPLGSNNVTTIDQSSPDIMSLSLFRRGSIG